MVIFTDHERNIERVYVFLVDLLHNIYYYHEHWNVFPKTIHTEYALKKHCKRFIIVTQELLYDKLLRNVDIQEEDSFVT